MAVSVIPKNISELKCLQDRLREQSITDELTGLYNRRGFFILAEHRLKVTGCLSARFPGRRLSPLLDKIAALNLIKTWLPLTRSRRKVHYITRYTLCLFFR